VAPLARVKHVVMFGFQIFSYDQLQARITSTKSRQVSQMLMNRHSGASCVWIRCRLTRDQLRLDVDDNGHGMEARSLATESNEQPQIGVGILGMRERLSELGGHLDVRSGPLGTKVSGVLPRPKGPTSPISK
jgi:signal transduction histidine kinase